MLKMWRTRKKVNIGLAIIFSTILFTNALSFSDIKVEAVTVKEEAIGLSTCNPLRGCSSGTIYRDGDLTNIRSPRYDTLYLEDSLEQIQEEIEAGECEMLAQLLEAEAGNQDFKGKCLVADVVLNRAGSDLFPDTVEEVIFQYLTDKYGDAHYQFSTVIDGSYDDAGWYISDDSFKAAYQEYHAERRVDDRILYFTAGSYNPYCTPAYIYGDHYFGY